MQREYQVQIIEKMEGNRRTKRGALNPSFAQKATTILVELIGSKLYHLNVNSLVNVEISC